VDHYRELFEKAKNEKKCRISVERAVNAVDGEIVTEDDDRPYGQPEMVEAAGIESVPEEPTSR